MTRGEAVLGLAALGTLPIVPALSPQPTPKTENDGREYTAIVGATALTGDDLTPLPDATILIRKNRIEAIGPRASVNIPQSAHRINAQGMFAIPGLIDSHVHFFQSGGLYTRPDAIDLRVVRPYTEELQWIKDNLHDTFARYLRAGITSVVDAGGPFWNYDVRAQAAQTILAPRVMVAGPLISSVERQILDPYNDPPIVKIDTVEAARALIDRELAAHTDYVKFWWVLSPDRPAAAFQPIARAAIDYAHERRARVIVHATELETARLAVESGTDILAHSVFDTDVDDAFLNLVKSRNVIYCPTLVVVGNYGYTFHQQPNLSPVDLRIANPDVVATLFQMQDVESALAPAALTAIRARRAPEPPHAAMRNLKRVHEAGIRVAAGTDAGNIGTQHASSFYDEALTMLESGLSPREILLTATRGGAAMMGRESDLGTLAPGKLADIVVLKEDPLKDIRAIASVQHVVKDGRAFAANAIVEESPAQIVQRQVNAYNFHDPSIFAATYAADAQILRDGSPLAQGRSSIEQTYKKFFGDNPQVHVEITSRDVSGGKIVDRERVTGLANGQTLEGTATYDVAHGAIARVSITPS
ncbi:MAG TPA: amidohydrolase family protein [Candidatus Rubrimentiphilum sp.]|nr:amidohydrolase family protein [Candidatus Rubrimentiphilum sp.]